VATDLFDPPWFGFDVGMNSRADDHWGVVRVAPSVPGWPGGVDEKIWRYNRQLQIRAVGSIESGVLTTGSTDPNGWPGFGADDTENWYLKGRNIPRFSLIGAFTLGGFPTEADWMFVGSLLGVDDVWFPWQFDIAPTPMGTAEPWEGPLAEWRVLWLAVNRPPPSFFGGGSRAWRVSLRVQTLDASDIPNCAAPLATRLPACSTSINRMISVQTEANRHCASATRALNDANGLNFTIAGLGIAWAIASTAVAVATASDFGTPTQAVRDAIHASTLRLSEALAGAALGGGAGALASLAGELEAPLFLLATTVTAATGVVIALATVRAVAAVGAGPEGWAYAIAILFLCAIVLGLLIAFIVAIGLMLAALAEHDREASLSDQAQAQYDQALLAADRFCCPAVVMADPHPGLLARPTCST